MFKDDGQLTYVIEPTNDNDGLKKLIVFPTNGYMQISHFAIENHIHNLINTYGLEVVGDVIVKTMRQFNKVG